MRWNTRILLLGCLIGLLQTSAAVALLVQPPEQHRVAAAQPDTSPRLPHPEAR